MASEQRRDERRIPRGGDDGWQDQQYGGSGNRGAMFGTGGASQADFGSDFSAESEASRRSTTGYRRADDRIRESVSDELLRHPGIESSGIDVRVENGEVTLSGYVPSGRARRMAADCAMDCAGVREVHNRVRVNRQAAPRRSGSFQERQ